MRQNRRELDSEVVIFKNYFFNWGGIGLGEDVLLLEARILKVLLGSWLLPSGSTAFLKDFLWQNRINKTSRYKFLEWKGESSWAGGILFNLLFLLQLFQISSLYVSAAVWHAALVHILWSVNWKDCSLNPTMQISNYISFSPYSFSANF